jgi:hypothetical protein
MIENSVQSIDEFITSSQNELSDIIVPTLEVYKSSILDWLIKFKVSIDPF